MRAKSFQSCPALKSLPATWETWVQSLGWEDPLEKEMATHSSTLASKIPWTEEPGRLHSIGSQSRTRLSNFTILCDPMDCSLPGPSIHRILEARILEWLPCPPPGDLPDPGIEPVSPALQVDSLPIESPEKPLLCIPKMWLNYAWFLLMKFKEYIPSGLALFCLILAYIFKIDSHPSMYV